MREWVEAPSGIVAEAGGEARAGMARKWTAGGRGCVSCVVWNRAGIRILKCAVWGRRASLCILQTSSAGPEAPRVVARRPRPARRCFGSARSTHSLLHPDLSFHSRFALTNLARISAQIFQRGKCETTAPVLPSEQRRWQFGRLTVPRS